MFSMRLSITSERLGTSIFAVNRQIRSLYVRSVCDTSRLGLKRLKKARCRKDIGLFCWDR